MKVNEKQRIATRKKIINAAVEVIIEKGLKTASMREIAKLAGIGDATIYNYFPTKEALIYGYYEDRIETAVDQMKKIDGVADFTLQEQLQSLVEGVLEQFLADREFVQATFTQVFFGFSQSHARMKPIRRQFHDVVKGMFEGAEDRGEIPDIVFGDVLYQLFWDYFVTITAYWSKDDSDQFANTSILLDMSLDLTCTVIKSGLFNKAFDMASFLFKNHILSRMDIFADQIATVSRMKKQFMGDADEDK